MANQTVLVLEDEIPLAKIIKTKLENNSYTVINARSVSDGIKYLKDNKVDFIWLDHYLLGKEDGLDFVTYIKEYESKLKNIPIFVVSNTASNDKVESYMKLGVNKYYTKSNSSLEDIINDIKNLLD